MNLEYTQVSMEAMHAYYEAVMIRFLWVICRVISGTSDQSVPAFSGFISSTGVIPKSLTTIIYYPMINEPITEYKVVRELLARSQQSTRLVGQKYTIITFDLGVVMKAMPIIWDKPDVYKAFIVLIGPFQVMNYMNMIWKKMLCSGYADILVEANLVTTGCLSGVLNGHKYAKALNCLHVVSEALERLLFDAYLQHAPEDSLVKSMDLKSLQVLINLISNSSRLELTEAVNDDDMKEVMRHYDSFEERVRDGFLGPTAKFWLSFLHHNRLIFTLIYAVKINDFELYHKCISDMGALFFAKGGQNYARYLAWYDMFLCNIEVSHPGATELLQHGAISVARSLIPGCREEVDKTMEETFMKFAKCRAGGTGAGITGLLRNYSAYQRWIQTSSERSKYYEATLQMCGIERSSGTAHHDTFPAAIRMSEDAVQRTLDAFEGFLNPFNLDDPSQLYIISSGVAVPADIADDIIKVEDIGFVEKEKFITERLLKNGPVVKDFFDPVSKPKLRSFDACNSITKLKTSQGNVIQYKEQGDLAFKLLIKSQDLEEPITIEELMTYSLTSIPHALGTPDGFMNKTMKSKSVKYLLKDVESEQISRKDKSILSIDDGNARLYWLIDVPNTFEEICLKILEQLPKEVDVCFSTDMYFQQSIKSQERLRRGESDRLLIRGPKTRRPADFKKFLSNAENKTQLFKLMLKSWNTESAAPHLNGRNVFLIVEGKAHKLTSSDAKRVVTTEEPSMRSNHEESDSRFIIYTQWAQDNAYKAVCVRCSDADVFFILLKYASSFEITIYLDMWTKNNRKMINVSEVASDLGEEYCDALLGMHAFTGDDANCAFKGKGKLNPLKQLTKKPKYQKTFRKMGNMLQLNDNFLQEIEAFTCDLYGHPRKKNIDEVRALMIRKMAGSGKEEFSSSKVDLSRLPTCRCSLIPHIKRANLRVYQWKKSHDPFPELPPPTSHGWEMDENGRLTPVWSEGPILPPSLTEHVLDLNQSPFEESDLAELDISSDEDEDEENH